MATILLLALTVTLFASIFAFVTSFPAAPAQNNNQFQASLVYGSNTSGVYVAGVHILHLAGPVVSGNALVYLKSSLQPGAPEFLNPYKVSSGLGGASVWNLGQIWNLTFPVAQRPVAYGNNITIYLVASGVLLFSVILPGSTATLPPTVTATWIAPAPPIVGQAFTIYATVAGAVTSVTVNLAAVPGGPGTAQAMTLNSQGQYTYSVASGVTTTNGTFYGFVTATASYGQQSVGAVVIAISSSGTSNGPLSVGVLLVPAPPNSGTSESVQAVVTYTGPALSSAAAVTVSFSASSSPSGYTYSGSGPSGVTISGPGGPASVTVVSQSIWTLPNPSTLTLYTFTVSATATVAGVGSNTGTTSFTPATITVGPASGLMGSTATARGAGYVPSTSVVLSIGGVVVTPSGTTNSTCTFSGSTITTTLTGTFVCRFVIPNGAPAGSATVLAADTTSGQNDTAAYTVTQWTVTIGPGPGLVGATVTARGAGFAASSTLTLTFDGISITPSGTTNSTCTFSGSTITATSTGTFVCQFVIPSGATPPTGTVVASDITYSSQVATSSAFVLTAWTLTLSPTTLAHGSTGTITITGAGFAGSSLVSITLNGTLLVSGTLSFSCSSGTLSGSTITTTAAGGFVCSVSLAKAAGAAVYTFVAFDYTTTQTATAYLSRT